eukprot:Gb_20514 [translate_table: standard]
MHIEGRVHELEHSLFDLPTLVLNIFPLQRLEKEYLMVQVLDHDSSSAPDTLGYTAIPLASAVSAFKKGPLEIATFRVELSHQGLPAGTLEGGMKLTWERNAIKRRSRFAREIMARTSSIRDSLKKTVSSRILSLVRYYSAIDMRQLLRQGSIFANPRRACGSAIWVGLQPFVQALARVHFPWLSRALAESNDGLVTG